MSVCYSSSGGYFLKMERAYFSDPSLINPHLFMYELKFKQKSKKFTYVTGSV